MSNRPTTKQTISVSMDIDLIARVRELAEGRRGGISGVIEDCVHGYLVKLELGDCWDGNTLDAVITMLKVFSSDPEILGRAIRIAKSDVEINRKNQTLIDEIQREAEKAA